MMTDRAKYAEGRRTHAGTLRLAVLGGLLLVAGFRSTALAADADALAWEGQRDVTFFVTSDPHIGFQEKGKPPRTKEQIVKDGRLHVQRIVAAMGSPYPADGPFRGLRLGKVAPPRGLLIAGDLTDQLRWDAFEVVFPAAGITTAAGPIAVFPCVGNHDGDPGSPTRRGVIAQNRAHERAGKLAAISDDRLHYAVNWSGVHLLCLNLYPADGVDAETPFKYGKPGPGSWNDPLKSLTFMKNYLRDHVGKSGQPVLLMHHYGFDGFSTNDWYWWTPKQRRAYYDAIQGYNIAGILHGHNHHADHYRWPNPKANADEVKRQFGDNPPATPRSYDVFSCGGLCWVFRITGERLVAVHWGGSDKGWDSGLSVVKAFEPDEETVEYNVQPDRVVGKVDVGVHGQFLEHIFNSVHGGLWGDMILNPGPK